MVYTDSLKKGCDDNVILIGGDELAVEGGAENHFPGKYYDSGFKSLKFSYRMDMGVCIFIWRRPGLS